MSHFELRQSLIKKKLGFKGTLKLFFHAVKETGLIREKKYIAILVVFAFFTTGSSIIIPLLNKQITDSSVLLFHDKDANAMNILVAVIIGLFLTQFVNALLNPFVNLYFGLLRSKTYLTVKGQILKKSTSMKMKYIHDTDYQEKLLFINSNVPDKMTNMIQSSFMILLSLFNLISIGLLVFANNWMVGLVIIAGTIPGLLLTNKSNDMQYNEAFWEVTNYKKMSYAVEVASSTAYTAEKYLYEYFPLIRDRFRASSQALLKERSALNNRLTFYRLLSSIPATLSYIVGLGLVVYDIYHQQTSLGTFSLMSGAIGLFLGNVTNFSRTMLEIGYSAKYVDDYIEFNNLEVDQEESGLPISGHQTIECRNVRFTYPGSTKPAITGLSVKIRPGEKIAIVGKNGSGKSTFTLLLTGIYSAEEGEILFNGASINDDTETIRRTISCAYQDFGKYEMSIADNIRIGDTSREMTSEELEEICRKSGVSKFADEMPDGLETVIGTMGEKGINLSGGQWQRVMFARALARKETDILIFDEPTAALDPRAEAQLYEDLNDLTGGRTTIIISHRLGITSVVDRILVFDEGNIVEDGSHQELLEHNGLYARMYNSQAQWYQDNPNSFVAS